MLKNIIQDIKTAEIKSEFDWWPRYSDFRIKNETTWLYIISKKRICKRYINLWKLESLSYFKKIIIKHYIRKRINQEIKYLEKINHDSIEKERQKELKELKDTYNQ